MEKRKLILASASPRRRELLKNAGYEYEIQVADVDESKYDKLSPREIVKSLAEEKARVVADMNPGCVVLGADTVVSFRAGILGKPRDEKDAEAMLRLLSGKTHYVYTGVCAALDSESESFISRTEVKFYDLTDRQIKNYVATGEPLDKAGAYGIQGFGGVLVEWIIGDYYTVMGLPLAQCARLLERFSVYGKIIDKA